MNPEAHISGDTLTVLWRSEAGARSYALEVERCDDDDDPSSPCQQILRRSVKPTGDGGVLCVSLRRAPMGEAPPAACRRARAGEGLAAAAGALGEKAGVTLTSSLLLPSSSIGSYTIVRPRGP